MPLIETKGAASAQGFGEFLQQSAPIYIEDVFSTWLYTGNGGTQTITNGIDLSTKGGLVWIKDRTNANNHALVDTVRGGSSRLSSNLPDAADTNLYFSAFNTTGFSIGTNNATVNQSSDAYVSWTFREQPKFFDIVSYTGNGTNRTIAHNLGSVPGCIMVKRINVGSNWQVYHRSLANTQYLVLDDTAAAATGTTRWNSTTPTATEFSLGTDSTVNANGGSYIAYLFAHNAGGFGASGTDNVISCGSFTTDGSSRATINLGYEPQWLMFKGTDIVSNWEVDDVMRGWSETQRLFLSANLDSAETANNQVLYPIKPTSTGFLYDLSAVGGSTYANKTYIYIAIRRGPMKVPTSGTSVFSPNTSTTYNDTNTTGFPVDAQIWAVRGGVVRNSLVVDRLRGVGTGGSTNDGPFLSTALSDAEIGSGNNTSRSWNNTGFNTPGYSGSVPEVFWSFGRAPSFFDVVCITGPTTSVSHNLGVAPEICIFKRRNGISNWPVQLPSRYLFLNSDTGNLGAPFVTNFGATTLTVDPGSFSSGETWVGYLFATCAGVSKVGSYTGTGALQTVNCGFTGGARFVLIKRTDSTGDWYVYDSARGISSGNDPYLFLNTTAAEVTGTNYVDTTSVGFQVTAAAPAGLNANGGTYIFLAIA